MENHTKLLDLRWGPFASSKWAIISFFSILVFSNCYIFEQNQNLVLRDSSHELNVNNFVILDLRFLVLDFYFLDNMSKS